MSDVHCKARNSYPDPQDCDWPHCGCDERASKVVEALIEEGWSPPSRAPSPPELERERLVELLNARLDLSDELLADMAENLGQVADAILAAPPRMGVVPSRAASTCKAGDPKHCRAPTSDCDGVNYCDDCGLWEGCRNTPFSKAATILGGK